MSISCQNDLGTSADHANARADREKKMREIVGPEAAGALAFRDQAARTEELGGEEAILNRDELGCPPAPSERENRG